MTDDVRIETEQHVLTLTLARPGKKNALTEAMYSVLADALESAEDDPGVRAILVRGEGDSFTAGNDLAEFVTDDAVVTGSDRQVFRFLRALSTATKPVVAAVHGRAVGVGTTLLLHCDVVFVSQDARLSCPFVDLALVPEAAASLLLPARIGHVRAYEMFALGRTVDGPTAVAWGLANHVVPAGELGPAALTAVRDLATRSAAALATTKRLMRDNAAVAHRLDEEVRLFSERVVTAEAQAKFAAFTHRQR
ncbi:enoyl-CoA hydratase-related protein [Amycolatopsis sp. NPDC051903]|uniref:enoyl-CoA hydratase-related protein n=1 Tax=Amycolatopsis sp. NPDC051903 TaxID=3363936 RepID=UPI0037998BF2